MKVYYYLFPAASNNGETQINAFEQYDQIQYDIVLLIIGPISRSHFKAIGKDL